MSTVDGVILAGGQSSRMGGQDKSQCLIGGRPMIDWVIDAARPQVRHLAINSSGPSALFEKHHVPIIPDRITGFLGPLMGLYSAMHWYAATEPPDWLAVFPCDTPFLPADLVLTLQASAETERSQAAVISLGEELQPTASLWHLGLLSALKDAVERRRIAGFKRFLETIHYSTVTLDSSWLEYFFNVNSPEQLERARLIARHRAC